MALLRKNENRGCGKRFSAKHILDDFPECRDPEGEPDIEIRDSEQHRAEAEFHGVHQADELLLQTGEVVVVHDKQCWI